MNYNKLKSDVKFGLEQEELIKDIMLDYFKIPYLNKTSQFNEFDYYYNNIYFEVKSRRCKYNTYPTTMIGYNKIKNLRKNGIKECYFIFNFEDDIYCYKYNDNDNFEIMKSGRFDRGLNEIKNYYHIPINKLVKIS